MRLRSLACAGALLGSAVLSARPASAQCITSSCGGGFVALAVGPPVATFSVVPLVVNIVHIATHRRTIFWPVMGFVLGSGSIAMGSLLVAAVSGGGDVDLAAAIATPMFAVGTATIGTGIWALAVPSRPDIAFTIVPVVGRGRAGASLGVSF